MSLEPPILDRAAALDLLPLYAGRDLDAATQARVADALERFPDLQEELASFEAQDVLLARSLAPPEAPAPAWLKAATATAPTAPLVRRQCPYCKDDLAALPRVFCALCLTPHHEGCFSENRGCSLLGCGGTRAIAAEDPSVKVCPSCSKQTPSVAPFCAWCGNPLAGAEATPRHAIQVAVPLAPTRRQEWARFAASVAVLLAGGLTVGWLYGNKQNTLMGALWRTGVARQRAEIATVVPRDLAVLVEAQRFYRDERLGGASEFAPNVDVLSNAIKHQAVWLRARARIFPDRPKAQAFEFMPGGHTFYTGSYPYEVVVARSRTAPGERFYLVARPRAELSLGAGELEEFGLPPSFFVNQEGNVQTLVPGQSVDEDRCVLEETKR